LNMYTEFFWTVNARSLMNFLNLRLGEDAQWEIRQFAEAVADKFAERMPATYVAWSQNNNQAP
jgi:thymidylate synthase (FAD)